MSISGANKERLPGFSAEASLSPSGETYYLINNVSFSTSPSVTSAFNDCPGCRRVCDPCNNCLRTSRNPGTCSYICNKCWACDCASPMALSAPEP